MSWAFGIGTGFFSNCMTMATPMQTGTRRVGPASARVRHCTALPEHMRHMTREVVDVEVPADKQHQGYGSTVMHKVCREADEANITLVLWPQPFGDNISLSKAQLEDWYCNRFGFMRIQEDPVLLARMPGATPQMLQMKPIAEGLLVDKLNAK